MWLIKSGSWLLLATLVLWPSIAKPSELDFAQLESQLLHQPKQALDSLDSVLLQRFPNREPSSSLWQQLQTFKVRSLISLGRLSEAEQLVQELIAYGDVTQNAELSATHFYLLGVIKNSTSNYSESTQALTRAKTLIGLDSDSLLMANILEREARNFRYELKYPQAVALLKKAQQLFNKHNDQIRLADSHNALGVVYNYMGDFDSAHKEYEASLAIQRARQNQQGISDALYNIGELYRDTNKLSLAFLYFQQSLAIDRSMGNPLHVANSLGKLSQVSLALGEFANAKRYVDEGIKLVKEAQSKSDLSWQLSILASLHLAKGEFTEAQAVANEALTLAVESGAKRTEHLVLMTIVDINIRSGRHKEALGALNTLLSHDSVGKEERSKLLKKRASVNHKLGQLEASIADMQAHNDLLQALYSEITEKQLEQFKFNSEFARQASALELSEKEQALQSTRLDNIKLERTLLAVLLAFVGAVGLLIVWRAQHKQRLSEMKATLVAQSLGEKKRLFADVSHELRTPLTASKLIVESLRHNIEPDVPKAYVRLDSKLSQLDHLIKDIYLSAQFDAGAIQFEEIEFDLVQLISEVIADFHSQFDDKGIHVDLNLPSDTLFTKADPGRLKQVIGNILKNSLMYTDGPGKIKVTLLRKEYGWSLAIEDSYPGVTDAQLTMVFERMYRCDSSRARDVGGSGLGLSISQQIIESLGWTIEAHHSQLGGLKIRIASKPIKSDN
ncbi:hypothetical protein PALB_34290 [Pseudoalteromonas luteoviolacea B = ATCC 29581]|nr:hypothetical protein PALB_34290 [Pseudoalteromonas luteoviolacea B = ATCC 29581]